MKNRFRFKLIVFFAATAIIPILIMGIVAVSIAGEQVIVWQIFLNVLFGSLIILILSILLARQISKPIEDLAQKAILISKGQLDQKIKIKTNDELEELGASFNKMIAGLRDIQKLKDEFVFIAAHELRAPVTVIRGYLSMALGGDFGQLSAELESVLRKVNNVNEQLVQLVNDLLTMAQAEAGRTTIHLDKVDLVKVTEQIVDTLKAWAQTAQIKLIYEKPPHSLEVMADENKLTEILNNFGSNAIKYNRPEGTVTIRHEERGDEIVTMIQDNGFGLSQEELPHLFEKFYRAKNDDTKKIQGTGLGLFIVKQLIEKMGGKVWVESERGKGSTFSFSLKKA
jgi:signal transduction histidine kinase